MKKFYDEQTLSNYKIAQDLGIDFRKIYRIDETQSLDIRLLFEIADYLNMSPTDLGEKILARWDRENVNKNEE